MSRHGRGRTEREAKAISLEVSRFLHFENPTTLTKELLLNSAKMSEYLDHLEGLDLEASTKNSKLNRIRQGVHFLSLKLDKSDLHQYERMDKLMKNWAAVLGKEARRANRERLETCQSSQ